jgi:subtilisin family serine protease
MAGIPKVYFRRDAMVFLVTHRGKASLTQVQHDLLMKWTNDSAHEILSDLKEPIKFAAAKQDFTFSAEEFGHKLAKGTVASESSDVGSDVKEIVQDVLHLDGRKLLHDIEKEFQPDDNAEREDEDAEAAGSGSALGDAPAGQTGSPAGDPGSSVHGVPGRPVVSPPPSFTVLFPTVANVALADLVRLAKGLDDRRATFGNGIVLKQVALDWYSSGGNDGLGSGGPGDRPKVIKGSRSTPHPFKLYDPLDSLLGGSKRGAGVDVAILDTSPSDDALNAAHASLGGEGGHPVIKDLIGPGGRMDCQHHDLARLKDIHIDGHDYVMSDHGLFVAGIIHTIAPDAQLHLIEVLNEKGVGDTDSVAAGLSSAAKMIADGAGKPPRTKWVVNASLMTTAPGEDAHLKQMTGKLDQQPGLSPADASEQHDLSVLFNSQLADPSSGMEAWLLTRQADAIRYMCDYLYVYWDTQVIAAAGNDRRPGGPQPGARYPARADSVLGVGALQRDFSPASYSNTADMPASAGIITFGGDPAAVPGTPGSAPLAPPQPEVLGVYIGIDPQGNLSTDGWAAWSGTSFATPIVSGVTAALLSIHGRFARTQDAIDLLMNPPYTLPRADGDFLNVTQL